jgi:hypothetical protein
MLHQRPLFGCSIWPKLVRPKLGLLAGVALAAVLAFPGHASACRVLDVQFTPSSRLQIVVWLEDSHGNFVQTLFITRSTGIYGLGNRPGIMEFNSEFLWPYGRRESLFPIWAHRRGATYPKIVFQDQQDRDLSHSFPLSSPEPFYCRPLMKGENALKNSIDANSCATTAYTDKGMFSAGETSLYPPRRDVNYTDKVDSPDVQTYATLNDLDAVSRATPPGGVAYQQSFSVPTDVPDGDYVVRVEVGKEFDQNETYAYPSPILVAFKEYGEAYRGQPSVVWSVPVTIDTTQRAAQTVDYEGYGDPAGASGDLHPADDTITSDTEGSGAQRLLLASGPDGTYRVRVTARPSDSTVPPGAPTEMSAEMLPPRAARISFLEPDGMVRGYDVRLSAGTPITAENFETTGQPLSVALEPQGEGALQSIEVDNLQSQTHYWVGIRAHDGCLQGGVPTIVDLVTAKVESGEVSSCFVATAAFGSPMASQVAILRSFRDQILRRQALGEVAIETYYTFGPALAGVIRPSDTLRAIARAALGPVIERARALIE